MRISSVRSLGVHRVYNLSMRGRNHNYVLHNNIISKNSNHSASYSFIALQTAYFKTHYPTEYMAAVLSSIATVEALGSYVNECRSMGIEVLPPSINSSNREFKIVGERSIQYGLKSVRGIGIAALERLLAGRRGYENLYDWLRREDPENLNKALIEHLLHAGALDELAPKQPERLLRREEKMGILNAEFAELGAFLTENPLDGVWEFIREGVTHTIEELPQERARLRVTIAGLVVRTEFKTSKNGNPLAIIHIQDPTGTLEMMAVGEPVQRLKEIGNVGTIIYATGRLDKEVLDEDNFRIRLFLFELDVPELPEHAIGAPIVLGFDSIPSDDIIKRVIEIVEDNPGDRYVMITFPEGGKHFTLKVNKPTSTAVEQRLKLIALGDNIR